MAMYSNRAQRIVGPQLVRLCQRQNAKVTATPLGHSVNPVYQSLNRGSSLCRPAGTRGSQGLSQGENLQLDTLSSHPFSTNSSNLSAETGIDVSSVETSTKMLNQLADMSRNHTSTTQIASLTCHLMNTLYQELAQEHKWLQTKNIVAYIQLLLENKLDTLTCVVRQHENFPVLYSLLDKNYSNLSNGELVESLLSLLYLGINHTDPLVTKMFIDCRDRIPTFDLAALRTMSYVNLALSRLYDKVTIHEIINRWKLLMADTSLTWCSETLQAHCMIGSNHSGILSADLLKEASKKVLHVLSSDELVLNNPSSVGTVLRFARIMGQQPQGPSLLPREITSKAVQACPTLLPQYKTFHIAECCSSLKFLRCYSESLSLLFEARALELLETENNLRDVSNLMYALNRQSPPLVRTKFMVALHRSLLVTEPDLIILSNMADSFFHMGYVPQNVLRLFQRSVAEKASGIISHQSRYLRITRFLSRAKFIDKEHKQVFMEKMISHLNHVHGINTPVSTNLTVFLLTLSEEPLNEKFFHSLLEQIPRWHIVGPSYRLALGLNNMPRPQSVHLQKQVTEIQSALYSNLIEKMNEVSLDKLYLMTIGLVVNSKNRDPFFTDQIMHMFLKHTKSLLNNFDDVALGKVITAFGSARYKLPEVFDDLCSFVLKYYDRLDSEKVVSVLRACSNIGYLPKRSEEFEEAVLKTYHRYEAEGNVLKMLNILYCLSLIQVLPEAQLGGLFSLEGIEKVDTFLKEFPEHQKVVEHFMLCLNRAVVLECPQLDVPWFHNLENGRSGIYEDPKQPWFCNEVRNCLAEVLGGNDFIQSPSYSYYGHNISIEIQLDPEQNPVPLPCDRHWSESSDVDRIAVLVHGRRSYCCNSTELGGWQKTHKRQLEIMGYRVIGIPHFEWYSMSLADHESKLDYLQGKLFDRGDLL